MKKIKKSTCKKVLPNELYINYLLGKRGLNSEYTKSINTKMKPEEYQELMELLSSIGVKRSVFVRYAIDQLKEAIEKKLDAVHEEQ